MISKMVNYCFALPILPGGVEEIKKFAQENTKTEEHDEFYKIAGNTFGFNGVHLVVARPTLR